MQKMGMPRSFVMSIIGLSWLAVDETMRFLSGVTLSQTQPEPKRVVAPWLIFIRKLSMDLNCKLILNFLC